MINRMLTHCGDETCPSCVVAGDYIYITHHAGGFDMDDIKHQMKMTFENAKNTLASVGASLNDMVQIHLYLKNLDDFNGAREVFYDYFEKDNFPARMTSTTEFLDSSCLCMIDGIAYRPLDLA